MTKIVVLDSGAMIAYLDAEAGGALVKQMVEENASSLCAHAINMCEVFYHFSRSHDVLIARRMIAALQSDGIKTRTDLDSEICEDAAQIKAEWKRVSLADCFGVALARHLDADFLTTDRSELTKLSDAGVARITFVR